MEYSVHIEYTEDVNDENRKYIVKNSILPNNRVEGVINYTLTYNKEQDIEFIKQEVKEKMWDNFIKIHERGNQEGRIPIDNPRLESIDISLLDH